MFMAFISAMVKPIFIPTLLPMKVATFVIVAIATGSHAFAPLVPSRTSMDPSPCRGLVCRAMPEFNEIISTTSSLLLSEDDKDYGEVIKTAAIVLTLGGGLIPATLSANSAMMKTLSGRKDAGPEADPSTIKPGESFDPTIFETKYRQYVEDSGAEGPELPLSSLLFAAERIPLVDIVAILGRIDGVNSIADWRNLPSTKLPNVSAKDPPQWLPRKAFKVNIRKAKFLGWPNDPKTGKPLGGEELKAAELARVSKKDVLIGDAALDAVFDSWAWGASIATPDKVDRTLRLFTKGPSQIDLGAFIGAAVRGRSATGLAALTFILIQVTVYGSLFVAPALRFFFDIDVGFGQLGSH